MNQKQLDKVAGGPRPCLHVFINKTLKALSTGSVCESENQKTRTN